jgi:hypothetical protein
MGRGVYVSLMVLCSRLRVFRWVERPTKQAPWFEELATFYLRSKCRMEDGAKATRLMVSQIQSLATAEDPLAVMRIRKIHSARTFPSRSDMLGDNGAHVC